MKKIEAVRKDNLKIIKSDFLIIGSGIAGLYSALKLSQLGEVCVLTKADKRESNSSYAQGGIAAVISETDSFEAHYNDTIKAGAGHCYQKSVELMVKNGPKRIKELIELGSNFDRKNDNFDLTKEGGHSQRRILHTGDSTGREISQSLLAAVKKKKNIKLKENHFVFKLLQSKNKLGVNKITGVLVKNKAKNELLIIQAAVIVMAAGGCGQLFSRSSNPDLTTGDGIAAAFRGGAEVLDLEFMQFHPTSLALAGERSYLISESVRGEGGILINQKKQRFMPDYHPDSELAPRDIVARAIFDQVSKSTLDYVYLDLTHLDSSYLQKRFKSIYQNLLEFNLDITKDLIPVYPAAHYLMGGIKTDLNGQSTIPGFFVCGEAAWTGVHGANRLASNSLLEAVVFAAQIYNYLKENWKQIKEKNKNLIKGESYIFIDDQVISKKLPAIIKIELENLKKKLQQKMTENAAIIRSKAELQKLLDWVNLKNNYLESKKFQNNYCQKLWEIKNLFLIAKLMLKAALMRKESRGAHYRKDFPFEKSKWEHKYILFSSRKLEGEVNVIK